jgi:hypothetical protein
MSTPAVIDVTQQRLRDLTAEALDVLVTANDPPWLFVRHGELVRVVQDERGRARLGRVTDTVLRHRLARVADFVRVVTRGRTDTPVHITPPPDVVQDLLARGTWPVAAVEGITALPVLRADGSVLSTAGYDPATKLIYCPTPGLIVPAIPESPTPAELEAAKLLVLGLLQDFPFVAWADMANMIALLFTPVVRPAIAGLVPLCLLDKPKRGTGASLLAQIVTIIAFGSSTDLMTAPSTDDEWRKKLTAALLAGLTIIYIDNVEGVLSNPHLAACLTSEVWSDRILGRSEIARDLVQRATWIATGNNLRVGGDLGRRCYHVRLDAKIARPWIRNSFRHPNLKRHVQRHRGEIIAALLTIARGWFAAGCPGAETPTVGGFGEWTRVLGGVLAFMGVPGFLGNLGALYEDVDEDDTAWEGFLGAWFATYANTPTPVSAVVSVLKASETTSLKEAVPPELLEAVAGKGSLERKLGWALRKHADAIFGDYRLERAGKARSTGNSILWRVSRVSGLSGFPPAEEPPGNQQTAEDVSTRKNPDNPETREADDGPAPTWCCAFCRSTTRFESRRAGGWVCGGCHGPADPPPSGE